jgi:hypothetical protein
MATTAAARAILDTSPSSFCFNFPISASRDDPLNVHESPKLRVAEML